MGPSSHKVAHAVGKAGPHARTPHPQPMGSRPRPHAPRTGHRREDSARPRTPLTEARGASHLSPLCRPHSAQSQLARAHAVGSVMGSHAGILRAHGKRAAGPHHLHQGRTVGGGRVPNPRHPAARHEASLPGALVPLPQRAKTARKSVRCGVGHGSPRPNPPRPLKTGSGPRQLAQGQAVGGGRVPRPGHSSPSQEAPLPGALLPPPQRAKPAPETVRCGACDRSARRHPPCQRRMGSRPPPPGPGTGGWGRESA